MFNRLVTCLLALALCLFPLSCSSSEASAPAPTTSQSTSLPFQELTAVGMTLVDAKAAITGLGFTWIVVRQDGLELLTGPEVPGRFRLDVEQGVVVRQVVDGVEPFYDVDGLSPDEAQNLLAALGYESRIVSIDGLSLGLPQDFVPTRYNLHFADGKIVGHEIDLVRLDVIWQPNSAD